MVEWVQWLEQNIEISLKINYSNSVPLLFIFSGQQKTKVKKPKINRANCRL